MTRLERIVEDYALAKSRGASGRMTEVADLDWLVARLREAEAALREAEAALQEHVDADECGWSELAKVLARIREP